MIEFVFVRFGQCGAVDEKLRALQGFRAAAVVDSLKRNHRLALFGRAKGGDLERASILVVQHAIARQGTRRIGEDFRLHLALQALRAHDGGK